MRVKQWIYERPLEKSDTKQMLETCQLSCDSRAKLLCKAPESRAWVLILSLQWRAALLFRKRLLAEIKRNPLIAAPWEITLVF